VSGAAVVERALVLLVALPFLLGAAAARASDSTVAFELADPAITESSGLVVVGDLFATVNDSGDTGRVYVVDDRGRTVGTTDWAEDPRDVEALAPAGRGEVWVADIGDNARARDTIQVARVPVGRERRQVEPTIFDLAYPSGAEDAETLLSDPAIGRLHVVTKGFLAGVVYAAPDGLRQGEVHRLEPVAEVLPMATDGAVLPGGRHVLLRNYGQAVLYTYPAFERLAAWDLPEQQQGETLAVAADGAVYAGSEGVHAPVLRLELPAEVEAAMAGGPAEPHDGAAHARPGARPERGGAPGA
jgi:hypothetical protein